jgi:hypothetical protein
MLVTILKPDGTSYTEEQFQEEQRRNALNLRSTTEAAALAGVNPSTLNGWVSTGVLSPTIEAEGTGTRRMWTAKDITRAAIVRQLREKGASLQSIRDSSVIGFLSDMAIIRKQATVLVFCDGEFALFTSEAGLEIIDKSESNLHVIYVWHSYLSILSAMEKEKEVIETSETSE